ncbi:MAG: hypothetical protein R3B84_09310 [Zavarzinella sp.]
MNYEYLHELEEVELCVSDARPISELLPIFRKLGFTFHDDVVSLDRPVRVLPWQHSSVVEIEILFNGKEVFGFDEGKWDTIRLKYLFATLPYELADMFVETAIAVGKELCLPLRHAGVTIDETSLRQRFSIIRMELFDNTGEEPGSEGLAILIQSTYPRR